MSLRFKKFLLFLFTLTLWGLGGVAIWWGMAPLPERNNNNLASINLNLNQKSENSNSPKNEVTKSMFEKYWSIPLRKELYDPPPPPPKVVEKPKPKPINIQLLATAIEGESTSAWIKLANGELVERKKGESIDSSNKNAIISEILEDSIIIKRGEEEIKKTVQ